MKNKKIFLILPILIITIYFLVTSSNTIPINNTDSNISFIGIVTDVTEKTITVSVNEDEQEFKSSDKIIVSLNVKSKDSVSTFNIGDKVKIFYDGTILESYPARINNVYEIQLIKKSHSL